MSAVQQKLDEQRKIIEYLASKYEKDTGRRIQMPTTLGQLLGDDSIIGDDKKQDDSRVVSAGGVLGQLMQKEPLTFGEAVEFLRLPKGEAPKKGERKKKEIQNIHMNIQPHHMLEKIDLSGFRHKYKIISHAI